MPTAADPQLPPPGGKEVAFPASAAQQAFWYLDNLSPGITAFNVPIRFRLDGTLDRGILEQSLQEIVKRHEILRTRFEESGGELLQVVEPDSRFHLEFAEAGGGPDSLEKAERLAREEAAKPFILTRAPLIRALLVKLAEDSHMLHVSAHHTVFDGWSIRVLTTELGRLYEAFSAGQPNPLEPLPIQYGDYSVWQNGFVEGPEVAAQLEYWKQRLAGLPDLELPTDRPRPRVKSWKGDIVSTLLPKELTSRLARIATSRGATLFHLYLAAFMALANRYTGADDIAIGVPVAGRNQPQLEDLIGTFINTLIVRSNLEGNPAFDEFLGKVAENAIEAVENQDVPFEVLVRTLRPGREAGRNPLFQINFTHQRSFAQAGTFGGVTLTPVPSVPQGAIFDVNVFMVEREEGWRASCDFSTDLFDRGTIVRMMGHFRTLLEAVAQNPSAPLKNLPIIPEEELAEIKKWSEVKRPGPSEFTIGSLFAQQASVHPEKTAILYREERITYGQLLASATGIANDLHRRGVRRGMFVGIAAESTPGRIAGLLGISLAGAAYVPLDAGAPAAWNNSILGDTGIQWVLADDSARTAFAEELVIPLSTAGMDGIVPDTIPAPAIASDPAYLLFTSGSTGRPKGVIIPHRGVVRLVHDTNYMPFGEEEIFLHAAPLTFDAATFEIWGALLNGGTLALPDLPDAGIGEIVQALERHKVTTLWLTAGLFQIMIEEHPHALRSLHNLLAGGDVLPHSAVARALDSLPGVRLINGYGPTENTTFTSCHTVRHEDCGRASIPIGTPVANTCIRIVDAAGRMVPIGVPGELQAGGDGLAIGYLADPGLTAEKFIKSPEGARWYRTGDRARWMPDGTIEFLGRMDSQIKIRGFRIEPLEVETALLRLPGVAAAKVGTRGAGPSEKKLVAWISGSGGILPDARLAAQALARHLPRHLCPDAIVPVKSFPLTPNGKIDTSALPDPLTTRAQEIEGVPPETPTEKRLAAIWRELIGISHIARNDDFFEIGGHSLLAIRIFERIRREFGAALPLASLLQEPTLAGLARIIDEALQSTAEERHPLSLITAVRSGGNRPPFVCIHGGDGGIIFYRDLAPHLGDERPFLAIEAPALNSEDEIIAEPVEHMAEKYLTLLRREKGKGPFLLGGYSFGGLVAFEMACRLAQEGMNVPLLALFDTSNPAVKGKPFSPRERLIHAWRSESECPLIQRPAHLARRLISRTLFRPVQEESVERDSRHEEMCAAHLEAMRAYRPGFYPGKLTLFKAADEDPVLKRPPDYGWSQAAAEVEIFLIPGRHLTLFDADHIPILGRELKRKLTTICP